MMSQKKLIEKTGELFYSLRLAIFLFIILAFTSIIGTIIPQNAPKSEYLRLYEASTYSMLNGLGVLDLYHSWWFIVLLILLCTNLLICSIKNFPRTWKEISQTNPILEDNKVASLPLRTTITIKYSPDEAREKVLRTLKKHFAYPQETIANNAYHFFAEKAKYSRLGVYLTHASIFIILGGSLLGILFGFKGYMQIMEGQTEDQVIINDNSYTRRLGFEVRCDDFEVTFYPNGAPKDYKSTLSILENGKAIVSRTIEVNHPLQYKGISFYQESYGTSFDQGGKITLVVKEKDNNSVEKQFQVEVGESFTLPDKGLTIKVNRFIPDFIIGDNGVIMNRSDQPNNPAVELLISGEKASLKPIWIFQRFPDFHGSKELAYQFILKKFEGGEYTGLQVTKDPGVGVVWIGCILMVMGILFTFFLTHRKVWVRMRDVGNEVELVLAGTATKNRITFEREFNQLRDALQTSF